MHARTPTSYHGSSRVHDVAAAALGKAALFARHPAMAHWPTGHDFQVYELTVSDVWMIANYGGGATVVGMTGPGATIVPTAGPVAGDTTVPTAGTAPADTTTAGAFAAV